MSRGSRTAGIAIAVPAAALACAMAATPAGAAFPGRNGLIAFDTGDGESAQIYTTTGTGSHLKQLTHGHARSTNPRWSADARRIVYVSDKSGSPQVWVMRANGKGQHAITHDKNADYAFPGWSPNGKRIIAGRCSHLFFTCDIVTLRSRGGGMRRVAGGYWHHNQPAFSPNGRRIAYTSDRGGYDSRVFIARPNGSHARAVTPPPAEPDGISWSPDGRRVAFTADRHRGTVTLMRATGGPLHPFLNQPPDTLFPAFSPDGRKLVAVSGSRERPGSRGLIILNTKGKRLSVLKQTRKLEGVAWSDWGLAR